MDEIRQQNRRTIGMTANLLTWREQAKLGDRIVYHTGFLSNDRTPSGRTLDPMTQEVRARATEAWQLYLAGRVRLYQRRRGFGVFEYTAEAVRDVANLDYALLAIESGPKKYRERGKVGVG